MGKERNLLALETAKNMHLDPWMLTTELTTRSSLAGVIFLLTLPATFKYRNIFAYKLKAAENGECSAESLKNRYIASIKTTGRPVEYANDQEHTSALENAFQLRYNVCSKKYKFNYTYEGDVETLDLVLRENSTDAKHLLHFSANAQDSMSLKDVHKTIEKNPYVNHTFWNYPGVAGSLGNSTIPEIVAAGVSQVKRLIAQGVKAEDITLDGFSLGGAVAIQVAKELYGQKIFVNLIIDRTFSNNALWVPAQLDRLGLNNPLVSAAVTTAALGMSLGIGLASIFKIIASDINMTLSFLGMSSLGAALDYTIDKLGSFIGGIIAVAGLISLATVGLCLGAVLSLQYIFTDEPWTMPMDFAFKFALQLAGCELDSYNALNDALGNLNAHNKSHIIDVTTTLDDEIIPYYASLQNAFMGDAFVSYEFDEDDEDEDDEGIENDQFLESSNARSFVFFRQHDFGGHFDEVSSKNGNELSGVYVKK